MPAITYSDFSGGLDRRLPITVQEASRLWVLRNAYVTLGKRVRKRPGLLLLSQSLTGSTGLDVTGGLVTVFVEQGSSFLAPPGTAAVYLEAHTPTSGSSGVVSKPGAPLPTTPIPLTFDRVEQVEIFNGFPYVVARYSTMAGADLVWTYRHHYVNGGPGDPTLITDANCPRYGSVAKAASRIYAINGDTVSYSAVGDALDWTTPSDAGFLATGLQQGGRDLATAVGAYRDSLVVFFQEGIQVWDVATDPTATRFRQRIEAVGTIEPRSIAGFFNDLAFLSNAGFRSISAISDTNRIDDTDIGSPVDKLVTADIQAIGAALEPGNVRSKWLANIGQYWTFFDMGDGTSKAWVYTYSKTSKIACWSEYTFPFVVTGITATAGRIYMRSDSSLYELKEDRYTDVGEPIPVEMQMAFQDAKAPGVAKQFYGADYVAEGSPSVAFKYDTRDQTKETVSQVIPGDTRPGDVMPVEVVAPAIAPVFRHESNEAFELAAATFYYNELGTV